MSLPVLCGRATAPWDLSMAVVLSADPTQALHIMSLQDPEMPFPCRSGDLRPRYLTSPGAAPMLFLEGR